MNAINFSSGKHQVLNGFITLSGNSCRNSFTLDRIEVPESIRRTGEMNRIIALLASEATRQCVSIDAYILPDGDDYDVAEGMVRVFARHGFKPLKMDGEVYRKDVSFVPKGLKKIKSCVSSNSGVVNEQK